MLYSEAREIMKIGDLIGFSGISPFSLLIRTITFSDISHVGTIIKSQVLESEKTINSIIESGKFKNGFSGVQINRMSQRVRDYEGTLYWYPLLDEVREDFNIKEFTKFLLNQEGKSYDLIQAAFSAIDIVPESPEDFDKLFCSEIVTEAYEKGNIIKKKNASEQTPKDVTNFGKYKPRIELTWIL